VLGKTGRFLAKSYTVLLTVAIGGFLGANLAGVVFGWADMLFLNPKGKATPPEVSERWMHGGWLVGGGGALVGCIVHGLRSRKRSPVNDQQQDRGWRVPAYPSSRSVLASAGVGVVVFGILGMMLGGSFLILWFSLAYSPLPTGWGSSVTLERDWMVTQPRGLPLHPLLHTTHNPVALYAFLGPIVLGVVIGAAFGVLCALKKRSARNREITSAGIIHESIAHSSNSGQHPGVIAESAIPYAIDRKQMPDGDAPEILLPPQVGSYRRESIEVPANPRANSTYANYRSGNSVIFVELGIRDDRWGALSALITAKRETDAKFANEPQSFSDRDDPSYFRTVNRLGAFMGWTRGRYYFSAHAKRGEADLATFMNAFRY
jgi:hypothetical protein